MLKFHVGSKETTVQYIEQSNYTQPCCYSCQKKSPHCCYGFIDIALTQFCTVRPALFLLAAIIGLKSESSILAVLEILTIISLIVAMICLLRVYNFLIQHTTILAPTQKVLFIKGIIILLVIQNMLVASQQKTGIFDNGEHMEEEDPHHYDKIRQIYAAAGIIESFIFSFLLQTIFKIQSGESASLSAPSSDFCLTTDKLGDEGDTYFTFLSDVLRLWTIIFNLPINKVNTDGALTTELGSLY